MVELQVKLQCEKKVHLCVPLQHISSLRLQQRPLPLRARCCTMRAMNSRQPLSNQHSTQSVTMVEALPSIHTHSSKKTTDECHLSSCPAKQPAPTKIIPSIRPVNEKSLKSSRNYKSQRASAPRLLTAHLTRHSRRAKMRQQEYRRLRSLLPSLQEKQRVSKVEVVAEAASYIDDLHERLLHRLKTRGLPQQLKDLPISLDDVHAGNIQDLVHHIMTMTNPTSLPPTKIENTRLLPSFIAKTTKHKPL